MTEKHRKEVVNEHAVIIFIIFVLLMLAVLLWLLKLDNRRKINLKKTTVVTTKYSYMKFGTVVYDAKLYIKNNEKYQEYGKIYKNVKLEFSKLDNNYFLIKGFDDNIYIKASDVVKIDSIDNVSDRYKNYIMFNENIITKDKVSFYDIDGNILYTIDKSYEFNVFIKDEDRYGIVYNDRLLFVKKSDVSSVKASNNTDKKNSSGVGVLNYHFFYDEANEEDAKGCKEEICVSKSQFKDELDYLKNNNILAITTRELEWYIDGGINLPKSVLITIDDGGRTSIAVSLLGEYKDYATIFLITSWFDPSNYYKNEYIELHSHTDNLHNTGVCPLGQGGGIKCLDRKTLLEDLTKSREKLNGSTVIAYPFYEYNDYSIDILKEAGFTMAFAGESSNSDNLVHVGSNKFRLPRFVMVNYTTHDDLNRYFSRIK